MEQQELIPHLFRTEYRKIVAVLCKSLGVDHIEAAEDIASETFLVATETWGIKGLPENPVAWLYTVAKNRARDQLRRQAVFETKVTTQLKQSSNDVSHEFEIDLSNQNIEDSQLQMMFAICHPSIPAEAQIGLSLRLLCGFGINEIADAFLSNKETINKRLLRAKEKLREEKVKIEFPDKKEIGNRLENVATTLYLLFNEGYYSSNQKTVLRKELCIEAMRLTYSLIENELTDLPFINALFSLMCFHASRFDARINSEGDMILYDEQDENLWDKELISKGEYFLNRAATGDVLSKYHLEAGIAYWHTKKENSAEKWENILQLYNRLLQLEYSPMAALNRTYALAMANGKQLAIIEAEKLGLTGNQLYHSLLGELYSNIDNTKAIDHLKHASNLARSAADKDLIAKKIASLKQG